MISPEEMKQVGMRVDNGFLLLCILAVMVGVALWMLYQSERFRRMIEHLKVIDPARLPIWKHVTITHILILAVIVRIPRLFDSFWYDEAFTARLVSLPLERIPGALMQDVHPPLSYAIQWVFGQIFGVSEFSLRLPALLLGVLLVWIVYQIGSHPIKGYFVTSENALIAAGLVAVFPAAIYYSDEARAYMLLSVFAFSMLWAMMENRPAWFALFAVGICWSHNLGYFYPPVLALTAMYTYRKVNLKQWVLWMIPGAIGAAAWLPFLFQQTHLVSDGYWMHQLSAGGVLWLYVDMLVTRQILDVFALPIILVVLLINGASVIFAIKKRYLGSDLHAAELTGLMIGVPLFSALVSFLWYPVYLTRALIPCALALAFVWALALRYAKWGYLARIALIPVAVMMAISFYSSDEHIGRPQMREMAHTCDGSDYVYATSIPSAMFAAYYMDEPLITWPDAGDLGYTLLPESKADFGFVSAEAADLHGTVCVLSLETPTTSEAEHAEVAELTARYNGDVTVFDVNQYYHVRFVRIDVG